MVHPVADPATNLSALGMKQSKAQKISSNFMLDLTANQSVNKHHGSPMRLKRPLVQKTMLDVFSTSGLDE
jgi:hypothetical protein